MSLIDKKTLVEAAFGRPSSRIPVWFLRQAGRYLPEYRELRSRVDFVELCRSPKLAAEVTLQPLRRFDLDASIIFSDILIPCTAMGQQLSFGKGHGPQLTEPVRSLASFKKLVLPNAERDLGYVGEAIALTAAQLRPDQTMIGFAGAPLTVATYMIEGAGTRDFTEVKRLRFGEPETFRALLHLIASTTIEYCSMQVRSGAQTLMLFDTWAHCLIPEDYTNFVIPELERIMRELKTRHPAVPLIYFPGQGLQLYPELTQLTCDVIAVDWRVRFGAAISQLRELGMKVSVQGNLDPQTFIAPRELIESRVASIVHEGKRARGHIFNVGHGLLPHTPPEALGIAIAKLRQLERSVE